MLAFPRAQPHHILLYRNVLSRHARLRHQIATEALQATSESISKFIAQSVADIRDPKVREAASDRLRSQLLGELNTGNATAVEATRRNCQQISERVERLGFHQRRTEFLRNLFCNAKSQACGDHIDCSEKESANAIAVGISRGLTTQWDMQDDRLRAVSAQLVRGLLGGMPCPKTWRWKSRRVCAEQYPLAGTYTRHVSDFRLWDSPGRCAPHVGSSRLG